MRATDEEIATGQTPGALSLSVVIASIVGPPFIDDCVASLETQARDVGAEVIVVARGTADCAARIERKFPWARVIHRAMPATVPELRACGVEHAHGDIVAIIEEHCVATPDWLERIRAAHASGRYRVVGGPVGDNSYTRLRDWVVYFCEYNGHLPPLPAGETRDLNGANVAYRRRLLVEHRARLGAGYWEASLHPALLAEGVRFLAVPEMVVRHRGPFAFGYYLQQRYWFSRAFAGARLKTLPARHRLAYLGAAPAVPFLLLARIALRVWRKRCHVGAFVMSLPLLFPALVVWVAGEWMGYLAGPGDALSRVE